MAPDVSSEESADSSEESDGEPSEEPSTEEDGEEAEEEAAEEEDSVLAPEELIDTADDDTDGSEPSSGMLAVEAPLFPQMN